MNHPVPIIWVVWVNNDSRLWWIFSPTPTFTLCKLQLQLTDIGDNWQLKNRHGVFGQPTTGHSPEMPYVLNLVKLGFLVLIPGGVSNWPSDLSANWVQIQQHPVIVAEQKFHYSSADSADPASSSTDAVLQSFNASSRRRGNGTYFSQTH